MKNEFSIGILIPMHNEEKGAAQCISAVVRNVNKLNIKLKLIVINDGSSDKTLKILRKMKQRYSKILIVVNSKLNRGYGGALKLGVIEAKQQQLDYVLFMDSDLTNDPRDISKFIAAEKKTHADCIKASRYMEGGSVDGVPFFRRAISHMGNLIASILFNVGINDCTNGFRLVKRSLLDEINLTENSFAIIMEEMFALKKEGATFSQVPVVLTSRKETASHFAYTLRTFIKYGKYSLLAAFI